MDIKIISSKDDCCNSKSEPGGSDNFDVIVVGAGSAGFSAAITAADQEAKIALISHGTIGGTCVNVGCVPSKNLIRAAEVIHKARAGNRFNGITATAAVTDWKALINQKNDLVHELRQKKYIDLLPSYPNVSFVEGRAQITETGVAVDGRSLIAEKIILTTGSTATIPTIEGIETVPYLTSTEAFELDQLPESMIVIGGGVIGCEVGQMFARFGTKVTILCRSRLLTNAEPEISENLEQQLKAEGISVVCGAVYKSIKEEDGVCLCYEHDGDTHHLRAQHVLIATGRHANTQGLGLEELGVEIKHGNIVTNENMQTTVPYIYAAGDVNGLDQFVYMAAYGGKIAATNALNSNSRTYDPSIMPQVVFSDPQVASVGLTEQQAIDQSIKVKTSVLTLENVPRALAARDTRGIIKLVADADSKRLIGAHILAPEGADSIQTMALAIKQNLTVEELSDMIFPYLTTVEGLKLAAQTFDKDVSKLSCCAG